MRFSTPSLIALDLDNTLYNYEVANTAGMRSAAEVLNARLGIRQQDWQKEFDWARSDVKRRLGSSASSHSRLLYFKTMLEKLGVGGHFDLFLQLENSYWQSYFRAMAPTSGAKEFLENCRAIGLPVVLMSDLTLQVQLRKVLQLGFLTFIHGAITSEEVGGDKPNQLFIDYAKRNLGLETERIWVVGDDLDKDRLFAQSIGADFFHVSASVRSSFTFEKLAKTLSNA